MVYSWTRDHCPAYPAMPLARCVPDIMPHCDPDVVDACPRVWASAGGYRMLGSVNGVSRAQVGPSLDALAHSCGVPYANASYDPVPAHFRGSEWLEAPAVVDAATVVVLTHVDTVDAAGAYLYTSTTLYASSDGGATFAPARVPPAHLVAASPFDNTNVSTGVRGVGFGMPSSILRDPRSGLYHVVLLSSWGETVRSQRGGLCLLRTADVTDPASWLAWNGSAFSVSLTASPLLGPVPDPDAHTCAPLLDASGALLAMRHLSLLWSTYFGAFLLFGEATAAGALGTPGWAFSLSADLVAWSVPTPVDVAGFFAPGGNATVSRTAPMPGRFIKAPGTHTYYEGAGWKVPVGSCEPCPALDACGTAVDVPASVVDALPNATFGFTCSLLYDTRGYIDYVYSVLVDDTAHRATGGDASLNTVGQDAHLFLVAKKCAGARWDHKAPLPACTPLDAFGRDERDVVRASIHFERG